MRKLFLFFALALLVAGPARADDYPRAELFTGYSYMRADLIADRDNTNGWNLNLAGNFHKNLGLVADFSGHYGKFAGFSHNNHLFLFGPRVSARTDKVTPFAQTMIGVSRFRALGESDNNFAWALGGGVDAKLTKHVAVRAFQADYILVRVRQPVIRDNSHNFRLSTGLVFRWGGR